MTPSHTPRYALVVATLNRGMRIRPLIESALRSEAPDFELAIIDQSGHDETRRAVEPFLADPRVRYFHLDIAGTSRARNHGFKVTSAPIIAITDDDCILPPDWLTLLSKPFDDHPQVGVVYCNVDAVPATEPGHTPNIRFPSSRALADTSGIRPGQPLWMGAGMAIRRKVLDDVQGFDEMLGPGCEFSACEDNDIAWRALVRGWWVYENAATSVLHDGFRSLAQLRSHSNRDFFGMGAAIAKFLKTGHLRIAVMLVPLFWKFAVVLPAKDVVALRMPRGWGRPYMLLRGVIAGLRAPLDRATLFYKKDPVRAA